MTRSKDSLLHPLNVEIRASRSKCFKIPFRKDRDDLWPGDLAKLVFESIGEILWVRVVEVLADGSYVGIFHDVPVTFGPENVADISSKMYRWPRSSDRVTEIGNEPCLSG